jgi:hypothetical protein
MGMDSEKGLAIPRVVSHCYIFIIFLVQVPGEKGIDNVLRCFFPLWRNGAQDSSGSDLSVLAPIQDPKSLPLSLKEVQSFSLSS